MKSKVAILRTRPESVVEDVVKVMEMADLGGSLDKKATTILKNNISCIPARIRPHGSLKVR